jgi:hypothetical protein
MPAAVMYGTALYLPFFTAAKREAHLPDILRVWAASSSHIGLLAHAAVPFCSATLQPVYQFA